MFSIFKSRSKFTLNGENFGVIIIFAIVTLIFIFSLSQSIYGKKLLSQKPVFHKQERIVSIN